MIVYETADNGLKAWDGDEHQALDIAIDYLCANVIQGGETYSYEEHAFGPTWVVSKDSLVGLGAALLGSPKDSSVYSCWCNVSDSHVWK